MTKLPELPEEIIGYILSFAPNYRDRLKACQSELLENKPIYYSKFEMIATDTFEIFSLLESAASGCNSQVKYINGLGRRVIWPRSIEVSPLRKRYHGYCSGGSITNSSTRYITYNYGWGREKDHESWKAVLKGEAGRKNLTTGYH